MPDEFEQLQERVDKIEKILQRLQLPDRLVLDRLTQILDGRNIQLGNTTGTKIGTASTQKLGLWGAVPVVQAGAITTPTDPSATYVQAEAQAMKTAVDAIRVAIKNAGITA